jgi:hypothetical protein
MNYGNIYQYVSYFMNYIQYDADPSGQAGLRPLACWDCGFESRRSRKCLSRVNAACCQVEVSASGLSLFQRTLTECSVCVCV